MLPDVTGSDSLMTRNNPTEDRVIWGGYYLDIRPDENVAEIRPWDHSAAAHVDVTDYVIKPGCDNCVRLDDWTYDKSAGIFDCDAVLINPTIFGGYDVRAVLLLDEWDTGRRLNNEAGLTDFWSNDPWHPDPYILFATENDERYFGPGEEHKSRVNIHFPPPANLLVPFIVDASYPDHALEPVEITDISVEGSIHTTGYSLTVIAEVLDWQEDAMGLYLDCSPLNPIAGFQAFEPTMGSSAGESSEQWTIELQYDATSPTAWLPLAEGEYELPLMALDPISTAKIFQRITVEVTPDTDPPVWNDDIGIDEIWWGCQRSVIGFGEASDPSGPVIYNIYSTTDVPLIPDAKDVVTGWSHYSKATVDGATYTFIVRAEDQAGNEDENTYEISGMSRGFNVVWEQVFAADLESSPTMDDINDDTINDVIFGCDNGNVYALNGTTGDIQWEYQTGGMVKSTAALMDVNDDTVLDVIVGSNDTFIYVLGLLMGAPYPMTTFETGNMVESSPVCADQTGDGVPEVVVGSFDNSLYAFEGGTGDLVVSYDTGAPVKATPSLEDFDGDTHLDVLVASGGILTAINGISGEIIWSYDFGTGFSFGSPAIADLNQDGVGDVVAGSGNGIYAFDIVGDTMLWSNEEFEGGFDTSPALGDVTGDGIPDVVISSRWLNVYLLDGSDGSMVWQSDAEIYMPTSPSLGDVNDDGVIDVVVGSGDYYLRILNGVDGYTLYKWDTSEYGAVTTIPLITDADADGWVDIVFGTDGHRMFALTTHHPMPTDESLLPWPKFMRNRANTGNLEHSF